MDKKAKEYFHCEGENYNCAQAVLKAFQKKFNVSDEMVEEYRKYGGGRADDNMCGALFAVTQLIREHSEEKESIKKEFAKIFGSIKCKDILKSKQLSCKDCVKMAAELLEKSENNLNNGAH